MERLSNPKPFIFSGLSFLAGQALLFLLDFDAIFQIIYGLFYVGLFVSGIKNQSYIFIARIVTPINIGFLFLLLYKYVYSIDASADFLNASVKSTFQVERFFEVLSNLYAMCTAFLLWKGLTDHDKLKSILKDEANTIDSICNFLKYFDCQENIIRVKNLRNLFKKYIDNAMNSGKFSSNSKNTKVIEDMINEIRYIEPNDKNDEIALSEIMKEINNLSAIRSQRISCLETSLSPYLLFAILLMSASIMFPLFTRNPAGDSSSVLLTMVFVMGTLLSFMFITMLDISKPFAGFWRIKLNSFEEIRAKLDAYDQCFSDQKPITSDPSQTRMAS